MMKRILISILFSLAAVTIQAENRKIKVACIGDSVTYGYGIEDKEVNSYPSQLQMLLGEDFDVRNFGHSGATLINKAFRPYTQQQVYKDALEFAADYVVIHLGLNDTDPRSWPNYRDDFITDYLSLTEDFRRVNPDVKIWICLMTPIFHGHPRFKSGTRDWFRMEQEYIGKVAAAAGTGLIDLHTPLYDRPDLFSDSLHPDREGAGIIAGTVYSALTGDFGGLKMPVIYTDRMVLQRDRDISVTGTADAGEKIKVTLSRSIPDRIHTRDSRKKVTKVTAEATSVTGPDGCWSAVIPSTPAGTGYVLTVSAPSRTLTYRDVAFGEVWLCSGQSNMAFRTDELCSEEHQALAGYADTHPQIRLFDMKCIRATDGESWDSTVFAPLNRLEYFGQTEWKECDRTTAEKFSAIGFAFGRYLADSLHVPIGLILNAVGGSPTESWISRGTLENEFPDILTNWEKNDFVMPWVRERAALNIRNAPDPLQKHPYHPCYLFESGIAPLSGFPIRGVLWYQGESNAHNIEVHERLFRLLVSDWRRWWHDDSLPFCFVQLSSIGRPSWPWFRDSQRRLATEIPFCYMAVSSDLGHPTNVHPTHKTAVAERLGRQALHNVYGFSSLSPSGPLPISAVSDRGSMTVTFAYGDGLHGEVRESAPDGSIHTFEIAGEDEQFHPASYTIDSPEITLRSPSVPNPRYVRYGWQPYTEANLVNSAGLPASTFRLEASDMTLPDFPGGGGIGVSGHFAGITGGRLTVAGGCNFPDIPAAEGGGKVFYRDIWTCIPGTEGWKMSGRLPEPTAYGAAVNIGEDIICLGGTGGPQVTVLRWDCGTDTLSVRQLNPLPVRTDNSAACADADNRDIYIAGGNMDGSPSTRFFRGRYLGDRIEWEELSPFPGPARVQPVMAFSGGRIHLAGGFRYAAGEGEPQIPGEVLCYDIAKGLWEVETDVPDPSHTFSGGCSAAYGDYLLFFGGVRKELFSQALKSPSPDYMLHEPAWYGFGDVLYAYDTGARKWLPLETDERFARAGASAAVTDDGTLFTVCGELKPGVRTPCVGATSISELLPRRESLLPEPRHKEYNGELFRASEVCITAPDSVSFLIREVLEQAGVGISSHAEKGIAVRLDHNNGYGDEGYRLEVSSGEIGIEAGSIRGALWGVQTLRQLISPCRDGGICVRGCIITDSPAFPVRGFLHDTGRSYISVPELKREIEMLSRYKINIFHWHLTENQAWRLESRIYPQLTDSANITRMPGKFYSQKEVREVVDWCHKYGMEVIPEIDMPGHSEAFVRTFGFDMQSAEGVTVIRELLREACGLFHDVPYMHLGTDEVKFTSGDFVPSMVELARSLGKKVISWNPGWDYSPGEIDITQMWSYRGRPLEGTPVIDCRFHYVNHFDLFGDMVALHNSTIYGREESDRQVLGSILAFWNDRALDASGFDDTFLRENSFYPYMLALSDRTWRGGGFEYFDGNGAVLWTPRGDDLAIPEPSVAVEEFYSFRDFENRLLTQKERFFTGYPFPYVMQSDIRWHICEPYPNGGELTRSFPPDSMDGGELMAAFIRDEGSLERLSSGNVLEGGPAAGIHNVSGGGIYLRHVWGDDTIHGVFRDPAPNGTAYAYARIWSPVDRDAGMLLEFHNVSRSEADYTPLPGTWDYKHSSVRLNGALLEPPVWTGTADASSDRETPLANENASARPPVPVHLSAGWNTLLLKLPVGGFSTDQTRLVKWQFTAVFTDPSGREGLSDIIYE